MASGGQKEELLLYRESRDRQSRRTDLSGNYFFVMRSSIIIRSFPLSSIRKWR